MLVPANGRTEKPFTINGRTLLYCWDTTTTGDHCYLDCETDLPISDSEALEIFGIKVTWVAGKEA